MKKSIGIILAGAALFSVVGLHDARAQDAKSDLIAPPAVIPSPGISAPAPTSTDLVPLSDLSDNPDKASAEPAPAKLAKYAAPKHKKTKHKKKSAHAGSRTLGEHTRIHTAQITLTQLDYRPGASDGVMGSKTRAALKAFQHDHHLKADGILGPKTYAALVRETGSSMPMRSASARPENFFATHPDYYGYYGADYANPTSFGSPQMIPSRFGNLQLEAQQNGQTYEYNLALNGQSVFQAHKQPSVINVSRTFNIGNADAIVLTSYAIGDTVCPYRHSLLVIRSNSNGLHQISNCTRNYEAFTEQGSLFISFPGDSHNGFNSGSMWRYENGTLAQL